MSLTEAYFSKHKTLSFETLEALKNWEGKVCVFGAGYYGMIALELLRVIKRIPDFFCDNLKVSGSEVLEGIIIESFNTLISYKENAIVLIAVARANEGIIEKQLQENEIERYCFVNTKSISCICEYLEKKGSEDDKERYRRVYDDKEFLTLAYRYKIGKSLDLVNPQTFNEKLQWLKIYDRNPKYTDLVDKVKIKGYVAEKIGSDHIIETVGIYKNCDEIDWDSLPEKFVIKCTHDSGSTIVCDSKTLDREKVRDRIQYCLSQNFYWACREYPYKNVEPRILIEKYIGDSDGIDDYKFLCYGGKVENAFSCTNRKTGKLCENFYDRNWKSLDFTRHYPRNPVETPKPAKLDEMIMFAETLAKDIPFVRVDFYYVSGMIYFGEMTFYPGAGFEEFDPEEWDLKLGKLIELPETKSTIL